MPVSGNNVKSTQIRLSSKSVYFQFIKISVKGTKDTNLLRLLIVPVNEGACFYLYVNYRSKRIHGFKYPKTCLSPFFVEIQQL
jgi:hypothetical protein